MAGGGGNLPLTGPLDGTNRSDVFSFELTNVSATRRVQGRRETR